MAKFLKSDTWECSVCMLQNKESDSVCVACQTANPNAPPPAPPSCSLSVFFLSFFFFPHRLVLNFWVLGLHINCLSYSWTLINFFPLCSVVLVKKYDCISNKLQQHSNSTLCVISHLVMNSYKLVWRKMDVNRGWSAECWISLTKWDSLSKRMEMYRMAGFVQPIILKMEIW